MIDAIVTWFQRPFRQDGNALNWILFVGLLIIATWMWNTTLQMVKE